MTARVFARRAQHAFWIAGALLCGCCAAKYLEATLFQAVEARRLEETLREGGRRRPHEGGSERASVRPRGALVGRLEIPRLGLAAIVLEGSDSGILSRGVGRVPETSNPGQAGNMALGGHRDTFFRPLRNIRAGDRIRMVTPGGRYAYVVEWTEIVSPLDTGPLRQTAYPSLTLVTCYPFHYVGPAPRRFIVRARQTGAQEPGGAPAGGTN